MANQSDADSAMLMAKARVDAWKVKFMKQWFGPGLQVAAKAFWDNQPDEVKAKYRELYPDLVKQFEQQLGGKQ